MTGIEPVRRGSQPPRRTGGEVEPAGPPAGDAGGGRARAPRFAAGRFDYGDWQHSPEDAWRFLSRTTRDWAEEQAGEPIRDPHTKVPTVYWNCWVQVGPRGPSAAAPTATYGLVMFGKRGLVASSGTTEHFVGTPGATRWRNRRFAVPVDPDGVRHDHRTEASRTGEAAGARRPGGAGTAAGVAGPPDGGSDFLPTKVASMYGHLPAATQGFQCEPFLSRGARPAESDVFATIHDDGTECRESYWAYMFDARWVTFAYARRAVPSAPKGRAWGRSRARGKGRLPSTEGLDAAAWKVSAWAAPVLRPGRALDVR